MNLVKILFAVLMFTSVAQASPRADQAVVDHFNDQCASGGYGTIESFEAATFDLSQEMVELRAKYEGCPEGIDVSRSRDASVEMAVMSLMSTKSTFDCLRREFSILQRAALFGMIRDNKNIAVLVAAGSDACSNSRDIWIYRPHGQVIKLTFN